MTVAGCTIMMMTMICVHPSAFTAVACVYVCAWIDEKQLLEYQQQEVDSLQHKVTTLRTELKAEMKQAKHSSETHVRHLHICCCFPPFISGFPHSVELMDV